MLVAVAGASEASGGEVDAACGTGVALGGGDGDGVVLHAIDVRSNPSSTSKQIRFDDIQASSENQ